MKIKCINKNYGRNGSVSTYTLQDETGRVFEATKAQICFEMATKRHNFVNLQVDKLGRLVYKAEGEPELTNKNMSQEFERHILKDLIYDKDVHVVIEDMAKELKGQYHNTDMFMYLTSRENLFAKAGDGTNDKIDKANDRIIRKMIENKSIDRFIPAMSYIFEKFIAKQGFEAPYKLVVKSKDGLIEEVNYYANLGDIKFNLKDNIRMDQEAVKQFGESIKDDPVRCKFGRNPKYLDPNNYAIKLVKLGAANNPIKLYIAPDMSLICPVQFAQKHLNDSKVTLKK